jgi:hypothetical protein
MTTMGALQAPKKAAILQRPRPQKKGVKVFLASRLNANLMSGERVETASCFGEVVDVQHDLRNVPVNELSQYTADEVEKIAGRTVAFVKLRVFEELGDYKRDADREDSKVIGMRHV